MGRHPLLIALLGLELTDILFAVDSVPAALSVRHNQFIVYSSNVFAILGLRALYSALAQSLGELRYLHYGLAGVLAFAAVKMIVNRWIHIHPLVAVGITAAIIGGAVWASLRGRRTAGWYLVYPHSLSRRPLRASQTGRPPRSRCTSRNIL